MRSDLLALEEGLDEISDLIRVYQVSRKLYSSIASSGKADPEFVQLSVDLAEKRTLQRKYQYVAVIVALYGAMEQYVESLALSYSRLVPVICGRFDNIPEEIRLKHHDLTVDYLSAIKQGRVHEPEDADVVVRRLARCRLQAVKYELNSRAFTLRAANMNFERAKSISANLAVVITPRALASTRSFEEYYLRKNGVVPPPMGDIEVRAEFSQIEELVVRRNRIAHGANSIDDIEDQQILIERVDHLRMYGRALYDVFESHAIRLSYEKNRTKRLGAPLHVYRGNIACFQMDEGSIAVGDYLFMSPTDAIVPSRRAQVMSLQIGAVSYPSLVGSVGCRFGVKLSCKPSPTASYGVLSPEITRMLDA